MRHLLSLLFVLSFITGRGFCQTTLLQEGFEGPSLAFSSLDLDNDGTTWVVSNTANRTGLNGASVSYNVAGNNDWLITTNPIAIPSAATNVVFSVWARSENPGFLERFKLGYSTDGINYIFDPINESVPATWTNYTLSKSTLAGQQVKFAIVCLSVDEDRLNIDDVLISAQTSGAQIPTVITSQISSITSSSATAGGNVANGGSSFVAARGVCWSTSPNPTVSLSTKTVNGNGLGDFTSSISGLSAGTLYYVRAYATNAAGTGYGSQITFVTLSSPGSLPVVSTLPVTSISSQGGIGGGNVTQSGGSSVSQRGVCWSVFQNPTIQNCSGFSNDGLGTGEFSSNISLLLPGTTYYVRAYATNSSGTAYGNQVSFNTLNISGVPVVTTRPSVSFITLNSANCGGNVTQQGNSPVSESGICWSTNPGPTIFSNKKVMSNGLGQFSGDINGLNSGTTYYIRAYARNNQGTAYGSEVSFSTTGALTPSVVTDPVSSITLTTAICGGIVTESGTSSVNSRGVCWGTSPNPTVGTNNQTSDGAGTGDFISNISGLSPNTTYYVRAYAGNSQGIGYGDQVTFTTQSTTAPSVQTSPISSITTNSAISGGDVTQAGTSAVTSKGVCWNTSPNPTTGNNKTVDGAGLGSYTSSLTNLNSGVTYYVRAYATSIHGTSYGSQQTFTTLSLPNIQTTGLSSVLANSAIGGGNVISMGSSPVTNRGICWNTSPGPTIDNFKTLDGSGIGPFTSSLTGLSPGTTYFVRAYATNGVGTSYGPQETFTTLSLPVIQTNPVYGVTTISAISGGIISSSGSSQVTSRGVCWSINPNPTTSDSKTVDGSGQGSFLSQVSSLIPATNYFLRAYATTDLGTSYGNEFSFSTVSCTTDPQVFLVNLGFLDPSTASSLGSQFFSNYDLPPSMQYNPSNPLNLGDLGKPIRFKVKCRNNKTNTLPITSGSCVIRSDDPNIIITDSTAGLNNLSFGSSGWSSNEFEIIISPNVTTSYTAKIDFVVKEGNNQYITRCVPIPIRPFTIFTGISNVNGENFYLVLDSPPGESDCSGNGNGICETNEQIETRPAINNMSEFEASYVTGFFRNRDNFSGINILTNQTGLNGSVINAQCWYNYANNTPTPIPPASSGNNSLHKSGQIDFVFKYNYPAAYAFDLYLIMTGGFRIFGPGTTPVLMTSSTKIAYNQGQPLAPDYPVGVSDKLDLNGFIIFPNPSSGIFNLKKPENRTSENHRVMVRGLLGQILFATEFNEASVQIDLSALGTKGIYFIEIVDRNSVVVKRQKVSLR